MIANHFAYGPVNTNICSQPADRWKYGGGANRCQLLFPRCTLAAARGTLSLNNTMASASALLFACQKWSTINVTGDGSRSRDPRPFIPVALLDIHVYLHFSSINLGAAGPIVSGPRFGRKHFFKRSRTLNGNGNEIFALLLCEVARCLPRFLFDTAGNSAYSLIIVSWEE